MKAWPHLLNLLLIVLIVLMFMGIINIHMTTKLSGTTPPPGNAPAYVSIDAAGNPSFVDHNGNPAPRCGYVADPNLNLPVCEGLGGPKGATQMIKTFAVMTVKGSTCYTFVGTDSTLYQICTTP